jgi:predicted phosphoadenosine phosphosulfate sulfurtransferase
VAELGAGVDRQLSAGKRGLGIDVLTAARQRIRRVFDDFINVYVSFSGGKDSGCLLELAAVEARARGRRIGVLIVDLEAQYAYTIDYIRTMLARHADVLEVYWVALPLNLRNAVSQFQPQWMCWDPDEQDNWVRPLPEDEGVVSDEDYFPFFERGMEFEDLVPKFGHWYSEQHGGRLTACLVGIRSDESINRYRTVASRKKTRHEGLAWTTWLGGNLYNGYPIYDWRTEDDWRYYGREKVPYNKVYDLMHKAGLSIHQARLCQPYGDDQRKGLWLYHVIEPQTWSRVVARVQGANFGARYSRESGNVLGRITITKPDGLSWEQYATALLDSMPPPTADHFRDKISAFLAWYDLRGYPYGQIPDEGPLDKKHPSWKRICKVLLGYDFWCRGLSFSPPANSQSYKKYKKRMEIKRREQFERWSLHGFER